MSSLPPLRMKRVPIDPGEGTDSVRMSTLGREDLMMARELALATMLAGLMVGSLTAHEVTYKGTVAGVEPNRYSAADGILARLEVNVSNGKRPMVFDIT